MKPEDIFLMSLTL